MSAPEAATIAELRRRIQGSFSPGELKELGAAIGLSPAEAWEKDPESAVRDIVRRAHEGPGLGALLGRLKRERPLVEWPEPESLRGGPPPGPQAAVPEEIPDLDGPTIVDPYARPAELTPPPIPAAAPFGAPASEAPSKLDAIPPSSVGLGALGSAAAASSAGPASAEVPPASWPLQNLPVPEKRGLDPRILAIAVACVALAVVVAFVGGIVFSRSGAPRSIAGTTRSENLAGHAANVMDGAIVEVARGCGLVVEGTPDRSVLRRAQASCGHPVAVAGRPPAGYDPADIEPPELDVQPPSPKTKPITGPSAPTGPPTDLCRAACKTERRGCMSACGEEPKDASAFEAFQQCHSKCLGGESTCRQRCQ